MDEGKSLSDQYGDNSTYTPEQRVCRFTHVPSNRGITEVAEGSAQQACCEQRVCRFPPSVENRGSVGFSEDSHHSSKQLEQRGRVPHFHADRSRIVLVEDSSQKDRSPIQYNGIPIVVQTMQWDPAPPVWGGVTPTANVGAPAQCSRAAVKTWQVYKNGTQKSKNPKKMTSTHKIEKISVTSWRTFALP